MKVKVYAEGKILLTCKYIWLDPFAPGTARRFTFKDISATSKKRILQKTDDAFYIGLNELKIQVDVFDKFRRRISIENFKVHLIDYGDLEKSSLWISGLVYDDYFTEYRQGRMDIFSLWAKDQSIQWVDLPLNSPLKKDYINSCLKYSGLSSQILDRDYYKIDWSLINEERDFLYWASLEFIGEKGYFGHNLYTFEDCLLEIFHNGGLKEQRKMTFFSSTKISDPKVYELYQFTKGVFERFKFLIEEIA
jgi:hypothetical protein